MRWQTQSRRLAALTITLLLAAHTHGLPYTVRQEPAKEEDSVNAQDIYGIGNRLGCYFQGLAFIIAFTNVIRLDPKSQFAGIVLAIQLLVRWWRRKNVGNISTSELWIALAELLLFTGPGCLLLYFSFALQRFMWVDENGNVMLRKDSVRGQGLNFMQAAIVTVWINVTNATFSWWIVGTKHGEDFPSVDGSADNPMWMLSAKDAGSPWIKWFMVIQSALTIICELGPLILYIAAWIESVKDYWDERQGRRRNYHPVSHRRAEWTEFGPPEFLHGRSTWLAIICGGLSTIYLVILIVSIERTIVLAGLKPAMDVSNPGQLLPMLTGAVSLASAIFNTGRPVTKVERFQGGGRTYQRKY